MNSINFLSSKYDEISDKMDKLEQSNNELKKTENTDLRVRVSKLEYDVQNIFNSTCIVGDKTWKLLEFQRDKTRTLVPSH